uniref:Uncharacterized protein n=1 Tax=Oryzias latipes TaxID=8090 RepID=A0A3P9J073_ORYLA
MVVRRQIVNKTISLLLPVKPEVLLPLLFTSSGRLLANRSDRRSDVWQLTGSGLGSVVRSAPSVPFGGLQLLLTGMGSPLLLLLLLRWPGLLAAEQVAVLEVLLEEQPGVSALLRGEVVESSGDGSEGGEREALEGNLVLVRVEEASEIAGEPEEQEPWIGLLPVDSTASRGGQESFADAVVNKMKRALVLGASALIILALHPNPVSEMDLSPVLSKPIIVVQTSENVTKLIGALLRGLRATAKITYQSILQDDLGGATLTLWSSCGRSRGGLYGEWQGVICTGESNSQVQVRRCLDALHFPECLACETCRFCSAEVPAAAVGHCPPGGADPLHRRHHPGPLAAPGPAAQRQLPVSQAGCSQVHVAAENPAVPSTQTLVRPVAADRRRHLRSLPGGVQEQPVSAGAAVSPRVPQGLRGPLAAAAAHLSSVQTQHPGRSLQRRLTAAPSAAPGSFFLDAPSLTLPFGLWTSPQNPSCRHCGAAGTLSAFCRERSARRCGLVRSVGHIQNFVLNQTSKSFPPPPPPRPLGLNK